jgi:hypothetical protein
MANDHRESTNGLVCWFSNSTLVLQVSCFGNNSHFGLLHPPCVVHILCHTDECIGVCLDGCNFPLRI